MAYGTFGDLRSILSGAPGQATWDALCGEVRRWPPERFEAEVLAYTLRHLERWPDAERVCRTFWVMDMLRRRPRGAHVTCLARRVSLAGESLTLEEWRRFVHELDWRSLWRLSLAQATLPPGWLEVLVEAPWFPGLRALDLSEAPAILPELKEAMLDGVFGHLTELDLGGLGVDDDLMYYLSEGSQWPALERLVLRGHRMTEEGFQVLVTSRSFPKVRSLDLRFELYRNRRRARDEEMLPLWMGPDALDAMQRAPWFETLEHLELFWIQDYRSWTSNAYAWGRWSIVRPFASHDQYVLLSAYFMEARSQPLLDVLGWD